MLFEFTTATDLDAPAQSGAPVLMYHHLTAPPATKGHRYLHVSPAVFARQMESLRWARYQTRSLYFAAFPPQPKELVITFDDGFESVFETGLPLLARHGFRAIQFLVSGRLGDINRWDARTGAIQAKIMDASQVREWLAAGHEIGGHTRTHPKLTEIPIADAREEIIAGKHQLEDLFGRPVQHFAYPHGDWNAHIRDLVQEAGYLTACTVEAGRATPAADPLALPRVLARQPVKTSVWDRLGTRLDRFRDKLCGC